MSKSVYQKTKEVYNKLGRKYLEDSEKITPRERLPFVKNFKKGSVIFDVGCGGGRDAKFFTKKGMMVVGLDVSDVLIKLARKDVKNAKFICRDILNIKLKPGLFDGVWAQAVLLHLKRKDVPKSLKQLYKVLKPGGLLHLRVKRGKGEKLVKEKISGWNERFYTYFSKKEMENLLRKEGFKIVKSWITPDELDRKDVSWIGIWARK